MASPEDIHIEITPEVLLKAYACGIFPMAERADDPVLYWIEPKERGVLPLDDFHLPRSLSRTLRRGDFEVRIDHDFDAVVEACAAPAPGRRQTWINSQIRRLYRALFDRRHAHTVEVWRDGALVGGLYGVHLGAAFFGESMFHRQRDMSKVALAHLVARLKYGGFSLLDVQFVTEHLKRFGAVEIARPDYHRRLDAAVRASADFYRMPTSTSSESVLQLLSQTS